MGDRQEDADAGLDARRVTPPRDARTLDRLLEEEGPLQVARALTLLRPLARDLDRLHARGMVHGEVRPWRMRVTEAPSGPDPLVTLSPPVPCDVETDAESSGGGADLLANTVEPADDRDAAYRSPQLLAGEGARALDDLYALGVIAYELLTGLLPFNPETVASPARRPLTPASHGIELPPPIEAVLLAQLSAAPSSRFSTAQQLVFELERAGAPDRAADRPASIADLLGPPLAYPTTRRGPAGLSARRLALAELPEVTRVRRDPPRPRRVRRNDYPELNLPGLWVTVIVVVLCSVYLLPAYYMLRRLFGGLFPDLFGPG